MEELLVIFACINNAGCSELAGHYYNTHPQAKIAIGNLERVIKNNFGEVTVDVSAPIIGFYAGGTGSIRLNKYFYLQGNKEMIKLNFSNQF